MIGLGFFKFFLFTIETITLTREWKEILRINMMHWLIIGGFVRFGLSLRFLISDRSSEFNLIRIQKTLPKMLHFK